MSRLENRSKPRPQFRLGYMPMLDIVRAVAIIIVVLGHANFQLGQNGHFGVDIFFTLSGFLITTLMLEEWEAYGRISFSAFYIRRAFRLFPALLVLLLAVACYAFLFSSSNDRLIIFREIVAALFYFYNISWVFWPDGKILTHTWSLAVEEQFYLLWPWICRIQLGRDVTGRNTFVIGALFVCMAIIVSIIRWVGLSFLTVSILQEAIFIGVASAFFRWKLREGLSVPNWLLFLSWSILIIVGLMPYNLQELPGDKLAVAFFTVICIYGAGQVKSSAWVSLWPSRILIYAGKISYSWYLWHVPIFKWIKWHSQMAPQYQFFLKIGLSILLAILSYELLEKHMIRIGRGISNKILANRVTNLAVAPTHSVV